MKNLWIDPEYTSLFPPRKVFDDMSEMTGDVFRVGRGRITMRFTRGGQNFFLKRHTGVGWGEIIRDLLRGRLPILGARNEWYALERLQILNISSLTPIAFGEKGNNPARRLSFLVTRELADTISLEDLVKTWQRRRDFLRLKRILIRQVALLARRIHSNGINHRDFYICHIHISNRWLKNPVGDPELFLIDLHRAQIRTSVPRRWLIKDIGSLFYSARNTGLTRNDLFRFMMTYRDMSLRQTLELDRSFWPDVQTRAQWLMSRTPKVITG